MIEIRQPELEALIYRRLRAGSFQNVEEVLLQALTDAPLPADQSAGEFTAADILAAFQRSPHKEIELDREGTILPSSDPVEF
jgi:hypothetical protein